MLGALLTGCGDVPSATRAGPPQPVIHVLLVDTATEQVATVHYTAPADSLVSIAPQPVAAESVALSILTPDGIGTPLVPVPGAPGRFRSPLVIRPGETYRLAGSVLGRAIEARTRVPGPVVVREPAADTLHLSESDGPQRIPYAWHAVGAAGYMVLTVGETWGPDSGRLLFDTTGMLVAFADLQAGFPEPTWVRIIALDTASTAFLAPFSATDPRPGNIIGALGLFGSATASDPPKVVLWQ